MTTGNKNADMLILLQLSDSELGKVCQVNKYINSLCQDDRFWIQKIYKKYKIDKLTEIKDYLEFTWKELYIWLTEYESEIKTHFYKESKEYYFSLLPETLNKTEFIDYIFDIYKQKKFPTWIDRKELLKTLKRLLFLHINTDIDMNDVNSVAPRRRLEVAEERARKSFSDQMILDLAVEKTEKYLSVIFQDDLFIKPLFEYKDEYILSNSNFVQKFKNE